MTQRYMSAAEAAVLQATLPAALTADMQDMALCLYEALVLQDERAGSSAPADAWLEQLQQWSIQVRAQLQHLMDERGGQSVYLAKGVAVHASERDRELCARFRGNNYRELALEYDLTEMRVRQIVAAWARARFAQQQGNLELE